MGDVAKDLAQAKTGGEIAEYLQREIRPLFEPEPLPDGEFRSDWPEEHPWSKALGLRFAREGVLTGIARGLEMGFQDPPADPGAAADEPRMALLLAEVAAWLQRDSLSKEPAGEAGDSEVWVPMSKLPGWPNECDTHRKRLEFLEKHKDSIRTKMRGKRHLVHAGDWARCLGKLSEEAFESLGPGGEPASLTGDLVDGAAERYAGIFAAKKAHKGRE